MNIVNYNPEDNPKDLDQEEEKTKPEEESAPLDDSDYEMLLETYKGEEDKKNEKTEDDIISRLVDTFKSSIMPKRKKEFKDKDLLKLIDSAHRSNNFTKIMGKRSNQNSKSEVPKDNACASIQRNIDKKLKKTVNSKVVNLINNNKELDSINKPKETIYQKIAHKIFEAQEQHKLYSGEATTTVTIKGKQVKQVSADAKILILYVCNLLLFSKKTDVLKTIDQYGMYFYDKNLCEANLRKLRGLALMDTKTDLKTNGEAVQEFLKATVRLLNKFSFLNL